MWFVNKKEPLFSWLILYKTFGFKMTCLPIYNKDNDIILNTPKRNELLQDGPPKNVNHNILGRGAFGTVFKAIYRDKTVAVKIVKTHEQCSTSLNEVHVLHWTHRNIVRVLKVESTAKFGLVIMEHFRGHCLQRVLDAIQLPIMHRICISMDILAALHYCHAHQLLHLDVKPQNVLVCYENATNKLSKQTRLYICKLCDFGSSIQLDTQSHTVKGTIRYMSPEALRDEQLTPAADIYSFGITMWQLQDRNMPYDWIDCNEAVAYKVVKHQLRPDARQAQNKQLQTVKLAANQKQRFSYYCSNLSIRSFEHIKHMLSRVEIIPNLYNINTAGKFNTLLTKEVKETLDVTEMRRYFRSQTFCINRRLKESYVHIYKSCWHSDPEKRPSTSALQKHLSQLLTENFI